MTEFRRSRPGSTPDTGAEPAAHSNAVLGRRRPARTPYAGARPQATAAPQATQWRSLAVTASWDDGRERRPHRSPQRLTAAVLLGVCLLSAAYRGAQAGVTPMPNYGDGGSGGGGAGVAVGVGAVAALAAAAALFGGGAAAAGATAAGAAAGAAGTAGAGAATGAGIPAASLALGPKGQLLPLPADVLCVTDVRLVPDQATIYAGTSQEFDLLARSFTDGKGTEQN